MAVKYSNNATTTLPGAITNSATSITVTDASTFPAIASPDYAYLTFASATATEVVKCTNRTGNVLTVIRAQEGTTASAFATDDRVELRLTSAMLTDVLAETVANAATSAANAATSEANAAASYDNFDDRWLGAKASNPTLDNDGNALIDGTAYFNTTDNVLMVYDLGNTTWKRTTPTTADQAAITAVNANAANINTCATDIAKIIKTADDLNEAISEIETVANDLNETTSEIDVVANAITNVNTVGTNIANVNLVGPIAANVTTVAGISSDVTTVAQPTAATNIATVAANVTGVNSFADRYRVSATAPTTSLNAGDLYFNTTDNELRSYGTTWQATAPSAANQANINIVAGDVVYNEDLGSVADALTSSSGTGDIATCASNITNINNTGGNIANVNTVAGIQANVTSVAGISSNVTTVAGISANVTSVAGKATEIGLLGNAATIADLAIVGTADFVSDLNVVASADFVSDLNTVASADFVADLNVLGTADVVNDMNILGTSGNVTNMNTLSGIAANITTCAGISADITKAADNENNINRYADEYTISGTNPSSPASGDLWYDSSANILKYFDGTIWASIAAGISDVISDSSPELGGNLDVLARSIVSSVNRDIAITPHGTGSVVLDGLSHPQADGSTGQFMKTDGNGQLSFATVNTDLLNDSSPQLAAALDCQNNNVSNCGTIDGTNLQIDFGGLT